MVKNDSLPFKLLLYFRAGWSLYFAFIFAAINTLTVTYFLAIENYSFLKEVFPSFIHYVIIVSAVGIPCLVLIGYAHYKRTASFKAEADIQIEANPHLRRILQNTEVLLPSYVKITELMIKLSENKKLTDKELEEVSKLQNQLNKHIDKRQVPLD